MSLAFRDTSGASPSMTTVFHASDLLVKNTNQHTFSSSRAHFVELDWICENVTLLPKRQAWEQILILVSSLQFLSASLLVSPFCDRSYCKHSNASIIWGWDFRIALVPTACASHLVSEREFTSVQSTKHPFRIFHLLVEAEKKVSISCTVWKKFTASKQESTALLPTRFSEWVAQGM